MTYRRAKNKRSTTKCQDPRDGQNHSVQFCGISKERYIATVLGRGRGLVDARGFGDLNFEETSIVQVKI